MTEDGRFLVFNYTRGNERRKDVGPRVTMVADLLKDRVFEIGELQKSPPCVEFPFVESKENYIVYGDLKNGFFRMDFARPGRGNAVKLCDSPHEFADMNTGPLDLIRLATHLTLTTDRKKAFLDAILVDPNGATNSVQGLLDLATGKFNRWGATTECVIDHGQLNPVRDDIALCAWEFAWTGSGQAYQKKTGFYPRMWLVGSDGKRTMIPAKARNFASHEIWDDDGRGFSWCGNGLDHEIYHHDLASGVQECVMPLPGGRHNTLSPDLKYVVYDNAPEKWWRGCKWRVGFYNRETKKNIWVYTARPALMPEGGQSKHHPDPHPQFVMNAKYIVSTASNADGHMDLYVTPVDQLIGLTR